MSKYTSIISPEELKYEIQNNNQEFIKESRQTISNIINWKDKRLLVIIWPCSLHNEEEAIDYAKQIKKINQDYQNLFIVMRAYFEKPRTHIWRKWLINDPYLNDSGDIQEWLRLARKILNQINQLWIPTATEFLDNLSYEYIQDLVSWWAIWARTTESQVHRQIVSDIKCPIGFKNWTNWSTNIAINAIKSASNPHNFLWINEKWKISIVNSQWNPDLHVVLRGWENGPNYDEKSINKAINELKNSNINSNLMIDFSHANSEKKYKNQIIVAEDIAKQIKNWNQNIVAAMIESNINESNQSFDPSKDKKEELEYWVSITDACVNIEDSKKILDKLNKAKSN